MDKLIVQARQIVGIVDINDFYKLTPNEFKDLCKGALLAQCDELQRAQIVSSMVKPVGLIDDVSGQTQSVQQAMDQMKQFARDFGEEESITKQRMIDAQAFHDLVMKRGRE